MGFELHRFLGAKIRSDAEMVIYGAPYDSTSSYRPGARFAPQSIREASQGLETFSPSLNYDLADIRFCDDGDIELPFGNPEPVIDEIEKHTAQLIDEGKVPVMLGGEHTLTIGAVKAFIRHYSRLVLVVIDAHCDLRDSYLGQKFSHATTTRRCAEMVGRIFLCGIRSGTKEEIEMGPKACELFIPYDIPAKRVVLAAGDVPVYLSVDLDVIDPAMFPGTSTPEPCGLGVVTLIEAVVTLARQLNIVGVDFVELCPPYDPTGISAISTAKVIKEFLIAKGMRK